MLPAEQPIEQTVESPMIWDAMMLMCQEEDTPRQESNTFQPGYTHVHTEVGGYQFVITVTSEWARWRLK